ncbi:MAG: C40 family peptidase [Bacteroidales bacterium]|nr:C40 family peptidase [Bacteroidales bacterium]
MSVKNSLLILLLVIITILSSCTEEVEKKIPDSTFGLVDISVCNMRIEPSHRSELVSQALMGTPVEIVKDESGWFYLITPDGYRGWVEKSAVKEMNKQDFKKWKESERLIYTGVNGKILADTLSGIQLSDIVKGCIVNSEGYFGDYAAVRLPGKRSGFLFADEVEELRQWAFSTRPGEEELRKMSEEFVGVPYLWGGTSAKAFDCSGFTKSLYFFSAILLERDASQQYQHGIKISRDNCPDSLKTGDLLFFGRNQDKPTHVGMYIGDNEYIHASGMVKINSLDSTRNNFSRYRLNSLLGARRIIGAEYEEGLLPVSESSIYF